MTNTFNGLLAVALLAGVAGAPASAWAESKSKTESMAEGKKSQVDEFEENRKAHMQKSKENNEKKGAN